MLFFIIFSVEAISYDISIYQSVLVQAQIRLTYSENRAKRIKQKWVNIAVVFLGKWVWRISILMQPPFPKTLL